MVTVYDVDALKLIHKTADKLAEMKIAQPEWVGKVKSGSHVSRLPQDEKFWYIRCASLLRKAYTDGPVGVSRLRTHYGGRKIRGVRPEKHRRAGGNLIRKGFQILEKAGLITNTKKGRVISAQGQKLLDSVAKEISS
jgi:small subunit ribosomal protein S19e